MGCVNSRTDVDRHRPNIFQVMNVDDLGNLISPGRLEVTDLDIVLYQRACKQPVKWPLRCLRRYGHDTDIFSFEAGRRCPMGAGIYAFKCRQAAQLFHLVQTKIQLCNNSSDDTISRELQVGSHPVPSATRVTISNSDPNYLDPISVRNNGRTRFPHTQQNGVERLGSVSSTGPMSPQAMDSPSPPSIMPPFPPPAVYANEQAISTAVEHNNNKSLRRMQRSQTASSTISKACYINVDIGAEDGPISPLPFEEPSPGNHAYMNVEVETPKLRPPPLPPSTPIDSPHCYANLEAHEIGTLKKRFSTVISDKTTTPGYGVIQEVNYAVLDLDQKADEANGPDAAPTPPDSPDRQQKGYATIDFNKTVALSQSVNPVNDNEGLRKTRHNSTINDFTPPGHGSAANDATTPGE